MNRDDQLRATVEAAVAAEQPALIRQVADILRDLYPSWPQVAEERVLSNAQISMLRTAAAWHRTRTTPEARLEELRKELGRVRKRAEDSPLAGFYQALDDLIWGNGKQTALWNRLAHRLERDPDLSDAEQAQLRAAARLALALHALDTLAAALTTRSLQEQLTQREGGWQWP